MMILPSDYKDFDTYFSNILIFLKKYSWVYDFRVTEILVQDVFSKVPEEWISAFLSLTNEELNNFPYGYVKDDWPSSLIEFSNKCQALKIPVRTAIIKDDLPSKLKHGLTPKKQHEVVSLSALVHEECSKLGVSNVLDVGAGLGYLSQMLHKNYGYSILGLESKPDLVRTATQRLQDICSTSTVKYITSNISSDSIDSVKTTMQDNNALERDCACGGRNTPHDGQESCVVGLHACGDLTVHIARLFLHLASLKLMVVVPCCYHKMAMHNVVKQGFPNFPLSFSLCQLVASHNAQYFICRPFLRLAAQETEARWQQWSEEDHRKHSIHVMTRAVLELFAHREGLVLKKKHRRAVRKSKRSTFESFMEDALHRYEFLTEKNELSYDELQIDKQVNELWCLYSSQCHLAEIVTALQVSIQGVAESFVMVDRAAYLLENAVSDVEIVKVMDDAISPRCFALIARK